MTALAIKEERKERKKIRLTISKLLEQSCEDCPVAKSKSKSNRYIHCGTKCPVGQKLKDYGNQLLTMESGSEVWTEEEEFYLVKNYPFHTTSRLAEILGKTPDQVRKHYKYLLTKAEMTTGSKYHDFRS